uniref:Uncharacterized protein n=1 Tax=Oryza sativa subsp. japonica TaxID=39947 RepID=Q5VN71_ORYSJ|nr:hypothetical protein [Oryza sativa Japonica Group]
MPKYLLYKCKQDPLPEQEGESTQVITLTTNYSEQIGTAQAGLIKSSSPPPLASRVVPGSLLLWLRAGVLI